MTRTIPAIASAILLTVTSSSLATAGLNLDNRQDIVPVAAQTTQASAQPQPTAETPKTQPQTAASTQVAAADHQAKATDYQTKAVEPPPRPKKVQRKAHPRYEEQIVVVRPAYRPVFGGFRFGHGRRW